MRERKFKKTRKPHKVFLVVCEGETEEEYVNLLKRHYRLPITIKTKVSGNAISERLVSQYLKEFGLTKNDDFQVFFMYDADIDLIVEKLLNMSGISILSNPSIELWFLLHSKDHRRYVQPDSILKELRSSNPVWNSYVKGKLSFEQQRHLLSNQESASLKAQKMAWPANPSSNMHEFIKALEAELP